MVTVGCTPVSQAGRRSQCRGLACSHPSITSRCCLFKHMLRKICTFLTNPPPTLACKDGISHTNKILCYLSLVSMLWGFSRVRFRSAIPPSTWHPSTETNWPRMHPAKAAEGRWPKSKQPVVWKSPTTVSLFLPLAPVTIAQEPDREKLAC